MEVQPDKNSALRQIDLPDRPNRQWLTSVLLKLVRIFDVSIAQSWDFVEQ
jgi:hypothetical protein